MGTQRASLGGFLIAPFQRVFVGAIAERMRPFRISNVGSAALRLVFDVVKVHCLFIYACMAHRADKRGL